MLKRIGAVVVFMLVSLVSAAPALAQQRSITGRVTSAATRDGIPGATVTIAGTTTGAITDENGNFTIANAPARDLMLLVRILGYRPAEVRVTQQQTSVMVPLQIDVLGLEELVVTGRATSVARRNLANAVGTVNAAELNRAPAESFERAIQGKVAGAIIEANSGAPGGGLQVRLRGVSTINAETQPLYVLDGVIISNAEIPSNQNAVTKAASGSNPSLNQDAVVNRVVDINPEDIESIEVLKGASAAAIYGSKASNGVVVITTRKGVTGRPRVHVSQRFGVFDLSNKLGFRQFETLEEATAAFGDRASQYWQAGRSFDHEELLAGRNDLSTETSASVSGGTEATRYFISGLWKNDEGVIENTGFAKQSVRLRLDQRLGSRASVGLGTTMLHTVAERGLTNNDNSGTSYWMVFPFTPNFVDLRESDNAIFPNNPFERSNPLQTAHLLDNEEDVWRVITSLNASFDLLQRGSHTLRIQSTTGIDYFSQKNGLLFPPELQFEPADDGLPGTSLLSNSDNVNVNVSGDLVHTMAPSDGGFSLTNSAGVQYEKRDLTIARVVSRNLVGGKSNIDAGTTVNVGQTNRLVKDVGFYAQSELITMSERLTVSGGLRAERTSANGDPDKYFFYPKAAASFRLLRPVSVLEEVKLRAAWGQSGNQPLFGQKFTPLTGNRNIEGLPGLLVSGIAGDPNIEPERQNEIEAGTDISLFSGRGSLELTVYQRNISNLLLERTLAPSTGFTAQIFNGGELRVRGIELAVAGTPIERGGVTWITRATYAANRSKVIDLPVPPFRTGGFGTALGAFQIEVGASATQIVANAGLEDNGDLIIRKVGDANPDFKISFLNDVTVGPFSVAALLDWQKGSDIINLTRLLYDFGANSADYDTNPRQETIANIATNGTEGERRLQRFLGGDTRPYIEDGSYVKLREVALAYRVPQSFVNSLFRGGVNDLTFRVAGRNLLTISDYTGLDPEVSNFGNQAIARNIDVAPFPPSRSFWISLDVNF